MELTILANLAALTELADKLVQFSDKAPLGLFGAGIGAAFVVIGAGYGIAKIGASSVESMARQPEASGDIRGAMIILAAMIEGVALFGVVVCLLGAIFSQGGMVEAEKTEPSAPAEVEHEEGARLDEDASEAVSFRTADGRVVEIA